jgi:hypothetical protein
MASKKKGGRTGAGRSRKPKAARTLTKRAQSHLKALLRMLPAGTTDQTKFKSGLKEIKEGLELISTAIHTHKL